MCEKCDGQLMLMVGEIGGKVTLIKDQQTTMQKDIKDNHISVQKEIKELRTDITNTKIKTYGFASAFGGVFGFLSKLIP